MNGRIERKFMELRQRNEKALVAYITAGDPDLETTVHLLRSLESAGVDVVEIGVPFSDPTADGPIIQAASQRALKNGVTLAAILDMIESLRKVSQIPIILFGYYNPIFSFGNKRFAEYAKRVGVDGILVVDLPPEESKELRQFTDYEQIDFISLIAPTSGKERIKYISKNAQGFLYYISVTGVTGAANFYMADIKENVENIHNITSLPLVVGFGVSTPSQAKEISAFSDGVVIGSAFVKIIEENIGSKDLVKLVSSYATSIKNGLI